MENERTSRPNERQTDGRTDGWLNRQTDGQTDAMCNIKICLLTVVAAATNGTVFEGFDRFAVVLCVYNF